jgi:ATP-binding cassette, subfamily C, bacterial
LKFSFSLRKDCRTENIFDEKAQAKSLGRIRSSVTKRLIIANISKRRTVDFLAYLCLSNPKRTVIAVSFLFIAALAEGLSVTALLPLVSRIVEGSNESTALSRIIDRIFSVISIEPNLVNLLTLIFIGISIKSLLRWRALYTVQCIVADIQTELRLELLQSLFKAKWSFFSRSHGGSFPNAMSAEAATAGLAFSNASIVLAMSFQILIYAVVMALVSWQAIVFAVISGLIVLKLLSKLIGLISTSATESAVAVRSLNTSLVDTIQVMKSVRSMACERPFEKHIAGHALTVGEKLKRIEKARLGLKEAHEPILTFVIGLGLILGFNFDFSFQELFVLGFLFWRLIMQLARAQNYYALLKSQEPYFWQFQESVARASREVEVSTGSKPPSSGAHKISFKNVSFSYNSTPILQELSFQAHPGELTVLAGSSGQGKTTILDLLIGFYSPSAGEVMAGEDSLADLHLSDWRKSIGYVPQDPILLHDTIYNNVAMGEDIGRATAEWALKLAGAWSFVSILEDGMDTSVGERGTRFSGGQRRRLCLARALVRKPKLLILDEVTAGLDPETEEEIVGTLTQLKKDTTLLAVTHQPALINKADVVYQLESGRAIRLKGGERAQ